MNSKHELTQPPYTAYYDFCCCNGFYAEYIDQRVSYFNKITYTNFLQEYLRLNVFSPELPSLNIVIVDYPADFRKSTYFLNHIMI